MRTGVTYTMAVALVTVAAGVLAHGAIERSSGAGASLVPPQTGIPQSIRTEHEAIHNALIAATKRQDDVGVAARELAAVLHPHFVREEQVALPPLGALAPLASGKEVAGASGIIAMADTLRREMPRMLEEHKAIHRAVAALRAVATRAGAAEVVRLADELAGHALTEEEVLYPAAIVVGDLLQRMPHR